MSAKKNAELEAGAEMMCCSSCGIVGGDDVKLMKCTACHLVRYCSVKCQKDHRPEHKRACKKRAAELRDGLLFKQPEGSHLGDCPICDLPIPIPKSQDTVGYTTFRCCSKIVCNGCVLANNLREIEARLAPSCPFCRHPTLKTKAEMDLLTKKRIEANDPVALDEEGECVVSEQVTIRLRLSIGTNQLNWAVLHHIINYHAHIMRVGVLKRT